MKLRVYALIFVVIILFFVSFTTTVRASGESMELDGKFGDWDDKPHLGDREGDAGSAFDISDAAWFLSKAEGRLYVYLEGAGSEKSRDGNAWETSMNVESGKGRSTVLIDFKHPNRVEVSILDANGRFIWGAAGKWGKSEDGTEKVEFYLPLQSLTDNGGELGSFTLFFQSGKDRLPDEGTITVSTIATFASPWIMAAFAAWVVLMVILYRLKLHFFVFSAGSIGLFFLLMYSGAPRFEKYLAYAVTLGVQMLSELFGRIEAYPAYVVITVYHKLQAVSFYVDYECSGIIETLVYVCLLTFYPLYGLWQKISLSLAGTLYIFGANVVRVLVICLAVSYFGPSVYFLSHTVAARILFFIFMIILYYLVFTLPHIKRQRAGGGVGI